MGKNKNIFVFVVIAIIAISFLVSTQFFSIAISLVRVVQFSGELHPQYASWWDDSKHIGDETAIIGNYRIEMDTYDRYFTATCTANTCNGVLSGVDEYGCNSYTYYAYSYYCDGLDETITSVSQCSLSGSLLTCDGKLYECYTSQLREYDQNWINQGQVEKACGVEIDRDKKACSYQARIYKNNALLKTIGQVENGQSNQHDSYTYEDESIRIRLDSIDWYFNSECISIQNEVELKNPENSVNVAVGELLDYYVQGQNAEIDVNVENNLGQIYVNVASEICQPTFGIPHCETYYKSKLIDERQTTLSYSIPTRQVSEVLSVTPKVEIYLDISGGEFEGVNVESSYLYNFELERYSDYIGSGVVGVPRARTDGYVYYYLGDVSGDKKDISVVSQDYLDLIEAGQTILSLEEQLQAKLDYIKQLNATIEEQGYLLNELEMNLQEKAAAVLALQEEVENQALLLEELSDKRDEQARIIAEMNLTISQQAELILEITKNVEDQQILIFTLQNREAELAAMVDELELTITQKAELIQRLTDENNLQGEIIANLEANLQTKAAIISQLEITNQEQAELINAMELSFADQLELIRALDQTIEEDTILIRNLNISVEEQDRLIAELRNELETAREQIEALEGKVSEQADLIEELDLTIYELGILLNELELSNQNLGALISELELTNSEMAQLLIDMQASLDRQAEIISGMNQTLQEDAELIALLNLELDKEAQIIAGLKLTIAEQQELIDYLNLPDEEKQELLEKVAYYEKWGWIYQAWWIIGIALSGLFLVLIFKKK